MKAAKKKSKLTAPQVAAQLAIDYADAKCALNFRTPLQLLISTILSAQCTDVRVNQVTTVLFKKYRSAEDFAKAPLAELEEDIRPTGFFRNKAKNIQACCQQLLEKHGGEVPRTMEEMLHLPGVGRKTANVVLGTAYGIATGLVVDTHVTRLANRMGLTKNTAAEKIEQDLMGQLPSDEWIDFSHRMIWHGRKICQARKPNCEACSFEMTCPKVGVKK